MFPKIDEGGFVIDYHGPPGASVAEMDVLLGRVEAMLRQTPEVLTYSRRTGFSLGGDISESNSGDFFVRLKPLPRRPLAAVMDGLRQRIVAEVPGLDVDPAQLIEDLLGDLSGKPEPVVVNLFADDEGGADRPGPDKSPTRSARCPGCRRSRAASSRPGTRSPSTSTGSRRPWRAWTPTP